MERRKAITDKNRPGIGASLAVVIQSVIDGKVLAMGGAGPVLHETDNANPFGPYQVVINRWEKITGRPHPPLQEITNKGMMISVAFVEWVMGLPEGWVTKVPGLTRDEKLKLLGNGVVPQQAELALERLGV